MKSSKLVCIGCPLGCILGVEIKADENITVTGNTCKRGEDYAKKEVTNPTRILTSTVKISGKENKVLPVKTKKDIPKGKIFECINILRDVEIELPIEQGEIVVKNIAGTNVDIVATKTMKE